MDFANAQGKMFTTPQDAVRDVVKLITMSTGLELSEPIDFGPDPDYHPWSAKFKSWDNHLYIAKGDYFDYAWDADEDEEVGDERYYAKAKLKQIK